MPESDGQRLVPAAQLLLNLQTIGTLGVDAAALREALGGLPSSPEAHIPLRTYFDFWDTMARLYPKAGVVSAVAMATPFGVYGVLDYLAGSAETLRGALETTKLHLSLVSFDTRLELSESGDGQFWTLIRCDGSRGELGAEFTVAMLVHRLRHLTDGRAQPSAVSLALPAAADESERTRLYGRRPQFEQPLFGFALPSALLDEPLPKSDPMLHATLKRIAATLELNAPQADSLELALRSRLRDALMSGDASPQRLARLLGLSERTLQRRLAEASRSYSAVVEDFRREEAARLLRGRLPLVRVADQLGYREQTSFTRAFRRWYGATPAAWRRRHGADSATPAQTQL